MQSFPSVKILSVLMVLLIQTGCASITRGTTDALLVNSNPSQADVEVYRLDRGFTGKEIKNNVVKENELNPTAGPLISKTPASFKLARKGQYRVLISKPGFVTNEVRVNNKISTAGGAGMAGNVLFGGLVGIGVDASTGAMRDLTPNPIEVILVEGEGSVLVEEKLEEVPEEIEPRSEN